MLPNIFLGENLTNSLPTDDSGLLRKSSLPPWVYQPIKQINSDFLLVNMAHTQLEKE